MKSKVKAIMKKDGGWNIKIRATREKEILSFFVRGFCRFLESLDEENRKFAKKTMLMFLENKFREDNENVQKNDRL